MNTDIDAVTDILAEQRVWKVVKPFIERYHEEKDFDMRPPSPTATVLGKTSRLEKQLQAVQIKKMLAKHHRTQTSTEETKHECGHSSGHSHSPYLDN